MTWLEFFAYIVGRLAWPGAVVFAACLFRSEVSDLIARMKGLSASGAEFEVQGNASAAIAEARGDAEIESAPHSFQTAEATSILEANCKALEDIPDRDRTKTLLHALTNQQYEKMFALIYADIFGSQIRALEELNVRPVSREEAGKMLYDLKKDTPALRNVGLDQYLSFLKQWNLIEERDGTFFITGFGKDFLRFRTGAGLSPNRPL